MKDKIRISIVSYLNAKPFVYGIEKSGFLSDYILEKDIPSVCADKLIQGKVDIGLIPVASLPFLKEYHILTDYCIGAIGAVSSVVLYSQVPLGEIKTILLDFHSRTSVMLARILAKKYWETELNWINAQEDHIKNIKGSVAGIVIGDRTFELDNKFEFTYDLSQEWHKFTGLPFVFACWVSNKMLPKDFITQFEKAIAFGVKNKQQVIDNLRDSYNAVNVEEYLTSYISYELDAAKRKALQLFLTYLKEIA